MAKGNGSNATLTDKQERFVQELIKGKSQREAYKVAYPKSKTWSEEAADTQASILMRNSKVLVRYNTLRDRLVKEAEDDCIVTAKQVLQELAKIAFSDGADFAEVMTKKVNAVNKDGEVEEIEIKTVDIKETKDLTADKRAAISCIKETKFGIAVESHDKVKALELLGKHLKLFTDKQEVEHSGEIKMPTITISK